MWNGFIQWAPYNDYANIFSMLHSINQGQLNNPSPRGQPATGLVFVLTWITASLLSMLLKTLYHYNFWKSIKCQHGNWPFAALSQCHSICMSSHQVVGLTFSNRCTTVQYSMSMATACPESSHVPTRTMFKMSWIHNCPTEIQWENGISLYS